MTEDKSVRAASELAHKREKSRRKSDTKRRRRYIDFQQALTDLEIAHEYQGKRLTYEELATQLGVGAKEGRIRAVDLIHACVYASLNPEVQSLPIAERIRIISSARGVFDEIEELWGDRGKVRSSGNQ